MEAYVELEEALRKWSGAEDVVACSSGTAALHLALEAMELPVYSEVIVPDFTMVACARAVVLAGLTPVFVDCRNNLTMDADALHAAITPYTSAVMPVHVYGRSCDMPAIHDVAAKHGLRVIEDSAEAHGVHPHPNTDAVCWSFYRNKIVRGEEGGAVGFSDKMHATLARKLRCLGFTDAHDFTHIPRGHNYRMSNMHATPITASLRELESNLVYRREVERQLNAVCNPTLQMPKRDVVWVYDFRIPYAKSYIQQRAVNTFKQRYGIAARHAFKPMSLQKEFSRCRLHCASNLHVAKLMSDEVLYLPVDSPLDTLVGAMRAVASQL